MSYRNSVKAHSRDLVRAIRNAVGDVNFDRVSALHEPYLNEQASIDVSSTINSGFVSSIGPSVDFFERQLSEFTGVKKVVLTSSGTSALSLALKIAGVRPGDDVIVPALSFIATANAVSHLGANPVFADIVPANSGSTLGISPESVLELLESYIKTNSGPIHVKTGSKLSAIVPMHTLGRICALSEIRQIASDWCIPIVEDAAEALGSFGSLGEHPGSETPAILSFNGNKTITTGGGGALLTNSEDFASEARHFSTTGKISHPWRFSHDAIAWNFRMPALNAALGISQMKVIVEILEAKRNLYERYRRAFQDSEFFELIENPENQLPNNWLSVVKMRVEDPLLLSDILDETHILGIRCRPMWDILPDQKPYLVHMKARIDNSKKARDTLVCLPSSPGILLGS